MSSFDLTENRLSLEKKASHEIKLATIEYIFETSYQTFKYLESQKKSQKHYLSEIASFVMEKSLWFCIKGITLEDLLENIILNKNINELFVNKKLLIEKESYSTDICIQYL